jgi:hypothetical protein
LASAALSGRRGSANTARIAAKQRRQTIIVAVLAVVLAVLLAYEVPHMLELGGGSGSSAAPVASASPASAPGPRPETKRRSGGGADPFAVRSLPNGDAHAAAAGGPDPFTARVRSSSRAVSTPAPLPKQIVVGRPGGHRVAKHGWIVILASIPTRSGRREALRFARGARRSVGALSVLNSSNRRPLRGGYWVVYSGPYATLGAVSRRASGVHAGGYRTAYIRELITYR